MGTIIFLGIVITILILIIRVVVKLIQHKSIASIMRTVAIVMGCYIVLWIIYYFSSSFKIIPLGSEICFDDWCSTVTKIDNPASLGKGDETIHPIGKFFILHLKMINEARRISQKPSEPRVHILDDKGTRYSFSEKGQHALEDQCGKQLPFDSRLELHQSLETLLVFDIPVTAGNPVVLIEEGPFITTLLFDDNKKVFAIP
jgi:hypothetical protein